MLQNGLSHPEVLLLGAQFHLRVISCARPVVWPRRRVPLSWGRDGGSATCSWRVAVLPSRGTNSPNVSLAGRNFCEVRIRPRTGTWFWQRSVSFCSHSSRINTGPSIHVQASKSICQQYCICLVLCCEWSRALAMDAPTIQLKWLSFALMHSRLQTKPQALRHVYTFWRNGCFLRSSISSNFLAASSSLIFVAVCSSATLVAGSCCTAVMHD